MIDLKELEERVILAAVSTSETDMAERSLDELKELADTAGAKTVGRVIKNRESVHPGTYLGKGKLQELREMLYETGATGVICDDELSPAQLKNLEHILDTKVMDRTMVILDIFAARANTREGKIQVELAQLKYRAIRLVGMRSSLSRLGGGIGTRGKTGNRPPSYSPAHWSVKERAGRCKTPPGSDQTATWKRPCVDSCDRRLYQCRKVHVVKSSYWSGDPGRG